MLTEFFLKSPEGLWLKSKRDGGEIAVFWQRRFKRVPGGMVEINANGDEVAVKHGRNIGFSDPWVNCGTYSADAWAMLSGLRASGEVKRVQEGSMQRVLALIAMGFGDTPEEVVSWFVEPEHGAWLPPGSYRVLRAQTLFPLLAGELLRVDGVHDGEVEGMLRTRDGDAEFKLPLAKDWPGWLCGLLPVDDVFSS